MSRSKISAWLPLAVVVWPVGPGSREVMTPSLPTVLADQFTLSQPGRQIMPTILLLAPLPSYFQTFLPLCSADRKIGNVIIDVT